jgi:hypothetical protein
MDHTFFYNLNTILINVFQRECTKDDYNIFCGDMRKSPHLIKESLTCNYIFIPRDAGFFSVFNYLIGMLHYGYKVYPYFNFKTILLKNSQVRHFCYLDKDIDNCWFSFFEPIKFSDDDITHLDSDKLKQFKVTQGHNMPFEFRYLDCRKILWKKKEYDQWRYKVHQTYLKFIKPNKSILQKVDDICNQYKNYMIAVHYRHPSHACEQSNVYFIDFFTKIDVLLEENPDAMIYLATDNDLGLIVFKDRYPDKIIYRKDVKRTCIDNILDWAYNSSTGKPDHLGFINNIGYQIHYDSPSSVNMGYDVLIDALCLSRCDAFVHTVSNVAFAVSYMNPKLKMLSIFGSR